ncbi:hypothetical protein DSL64_03755 [Dyadobacter luteus]|uniref:Thioredoxin domain-containing protein n=1 Tax=Dyadobacter luteus TaxID=2259619 RepID=A0A3D8YFT9_9BACT|nr:TlpA disulfide reductase family protein [Dyadobacter luteus]REA63568.1 hypothetical protein DSL64_03755 [Dyadobacter luteus]
MNSRFCSPGKLLPYLFYLLLSFILMLCWRPVKAQTGAVRQLAIGDTLPDITVSNVLNYKTPTVKLSDFKGKLLIIDFWATWCGACVSMLPRLDSLQKQFDDKIQILPVAYQDAKAVQTFLSKYQAKTTRRIVLPQVIADSVLHELFPHRYVPHYVWISSEGVVLTFTGMEEMNASTIRKVLEGKAGDIRQKKDEKGIAYDVKKPFLVGGNGGDGKELIYHSVLANYTEGLLSAGYSIIKDSTELRIVLRNTPLSSMFRVAYGGNGYLGKNRMILEVNDPGRLRSDLTGQKYTDWKKQGNAFCYEVKVPAAVGKEAYTIMQQDFARLFSRYKASMQRRSRTCLVLTRTDSVDHIRSKGGRPLMATEYGQFTLQNKKLLFLISQLNVISMQDSPYPVVDGTGYTDPVDLILDADLSDIADLNRALKPYGLTLNEKVREIDMLVISDNL